MQTISRLFRLTFSCIYFAGTKGLRTLNRLTGRRLRPTLTVLMYHLVTDAERFAFISHMDFLLRAGNAVDAGNLPILELGRHYVAVTFDDGYAVCATAYQECRKRGIPVTLFVPSDFLNRKPDWITQEYAEFQDQRIIDERELKELSRLSVTVGSHTATHTHLDTQDAQSLEKELAGSRKRLEAIVDRPVTVLSLPFGSYSQEVLCSARQAGYKKVFLNIPSFPASDTGRFLLGRTDISCRDWNLEYRLKILGGYHWLAIASAAKRLLLGKRKHDHFHN
jgi:peptidoglycan/xylan/chitin deacetylase (PgdA/CDA1 family)